MENQKINSINMKAEFVGGEAFLWAVIQVIRERLASRVIRDYFDEEVVNKLEVTLDSFNNKVLNDAETKQYQDLNVKHWLNDLKHVLYEVEQLLDVVAIDAQGKGKIGYFISATINRFKYRIKALLNWLKVLADKKNRLGLEKDSYEIRLGQILSREFTTEFCVDDESVIYGREHEKEEIIDFLLSDSDSISKVSIFSIVGLMGMGKTTLAQFVFNDPRIMEQFDFTVWVCVSESFDVIHLTQSILKSIDSSEVYIQNLDLLHRKLQQRLAGKRYLLVLDDVWNIDRHTWHTFVLLFSGSPGGKMIVTTHDMKVASVIGSTRLLHLKELQENDSWSLFMKDAFRGRNVFEYPNLELIGKKIVKKCGGLPLALKTLGNILQTKSSESEWVKILDTDLWRLPEVDKHINSILRLSYFNFPSNLKRCFAYCSIFPKGYEFNKGELIKLWMAEGLLKRWRANGEELGNEFFDHLVSISFFQQSVIMPLWTGNFFTMHDLVNDFAKSVSGESCLRIEGDNMLDIPKRTRHIWCCLDLIDGDRKLEHISKIEGLYSLMVQPQGYGDQRFKTLLLQDCFKLTELPSDFYKLVNLRHLNLEGTHIKKMPKKIGGLNKLQILTNFVLAEQHGIDIKQLEKLDHLQGRLQISGLENVIDPADAVAANLEDKKHLVELSMSYDQWREIDGSVTEEHISVLEALKPNRNLMGLTIKDYRDISFPNWLRDRHLPNLVSLELLGCKLCSKMPPLGQFPSLKKLSISGCDGIKIIDTEFYGYDSSDVPFRSLETLRFEHMSELTEWLCLEGFPLLQELCIKNCPKLKSDLPQHLPSLQKLEIIDCQELEASIPRSANISELELKRCDDIWINEFSSTLKRVILCGTQVIRSSLEKILFNNAFLVELEVEEFFGQNLEWSSLDFSSRNSLRSLTISGWHSSSLPFALHLFTNLNSLVLYDCPSLESFSGSQLPSNLSSLGIERCPELMASREEWGLFQLNSLKQFRVSDDFEIFESFPEESLLPSTINSLELTNCSNLRIINHNGLLHLTSLESLYIEDCPCLESLPEDGLPSSLSTLSIHDCPLIMQQYQKERGERWHTISHIPDVIIS